MLHTFEKFEDSHLAPFYFYLFIILFYFSFLKGKSGGGGRKVQFKKSSKGATLKTEMKILIGRLRHLSDVVVKNDTVKLRKKSYLNLKKYFRCQIDKRLGSV